MSDDAPKKLPPLEELTTACPGSKHAPCFRLMLTEQGVELLDNLVVHEYDTYECRECGASCIALSRD